MGLFNELGRKVEEFKQTATASAESDDYLCAACDERLESDHEECPACGEAAIHSTSFEE
jgi:rRNA maturation endonuclease Nob1